MGNHITRRGIMGAALAVPALEMLTSAAAVAATGPAVGVSPELQRLIDSWEAQDKRIDAFYASTFNPAIERRNAMRKAIPHFEIDGSLEGDGRVIWTTADRVNVACARGIAQIDNRFQHQGAKWQDKRRRARTFYAAHLRRERAIAQTSRDSGADEAARMEEELYVPRRVTAGKVHNYPVASLADLRAKLAFIERDDGMDGEDLLPLVIADVARLSGGEA